MSKRIIGIDVARALAVIGMIIVNFKLVIGQKGEHWLKQFAMPFEGKAAATFVVLAGVGLALMSNSAVETQDEVKLKRSSVRIVKRAAFLFIVGLSYIWIWPADILHFYGVYMLISLLFINKAAYHALLSAVLFILLYPLLLLLWPYEVGWDFVNMNYTDFWTRDGFIRNLFYNGFHPVFPWTAFMLFGLWLGKQDLRNTAFVKKSMWISLAVFSSIQLISYYSLSILSQGADANSQESLNIVLGTEPMPPMPLYMLSGMAIATFVITGCILLGQRFENNVIIQSLNKTGQLALSFYVAHVVIGMGLVEGYNGKALGSFSAQFSISYALLFSLACVLFAVLWLKYKKAGPLEWLMRKITD